MERKLSRFTLRHSVLLAAAIGLIVVFYAYPAPQWAPWELAAPLTMPGGGRTESSAPATDQRLAATRSTSPDVPGVLFKRPLSQNHHVVGIETRQGEGDIVAFLLNG
jgi:hypothetical protein